MALSLSDLTTRCASFQLGYYRYYPELREYFKLLELSGCRTTEPLDVSRWTFVDSATLLLQPLKGNNQRVISVGSSCPNFVEDVRLRRKPFKGRTLANVYSAFDDIRNFRNLKSQDKPISVYIFRYRFIKSLYASGMNIQQVANTMGYTSTDTPQYYLQAELVEDNDDLPPYTCKIGNQIWSTRNSCISDGGTGILSRGPAFDRVFGFYYNNAAVYRLSSKLNGSRIPTVSDFQEFRTYFYSRSIPMWKLCNPSPLRFNQTLDHASNFNGFNACGSGYFIDSNLVSFLTFGCFSLFNGSNLNARIFQGSSSEHLWSYYTRGLNLHPIRLILNSPILT